MPTPISGVICPECGKAVPEDEHVRVSASLIRSDGLGGTNEVPIGNDMFHVECWDNISGESADE